MKTCLETLGQFKRINGKSFKVEKTFLGGIEIMNLFPILCNETQWQTKCAVP